MKKRDDINHEAAISWYLSQKAARAGSPVNGTFELTGRCNFSCKMCYVHEQENSDEWKEKELSVSDWLDIAKEAKQAGLLYLLLTGGEAMMREDFVELYEALSQMGFRLVINTNGSMLTSEIEHCFKKYPPARVNVSIYGASEETYENLCGRRAWRKVTDTVRKLISMGISVRTTTVLTTYNCHDMEKIYEFDKSQTSLIEMTPYLFPPIRLKQGHSGENVARLSAEEAGKYMVKRDYLLFDSREEFIEKGRRFLKTGTGCPYEIQHLGNAQGDESRCGAGRNSFWITWNGKMRPCGLMTYPEADVRKLGFDKAWKQIKDEVSKIRLPYECKTCRHSRFCKICAAICQSETGRFDQRPDYLCQMSESAKAAYAEAIEMLQGLEKKEEADV